MAGDIVLDDQGGGRMDESVVEKRDQVLAVLEIGVRVARLRRGGGGGRHQAIGRQCLSKL
jgi:hypothetical protein